MGRPCVSGFPLFYYQYSTSGGGGQGDSSIFRSGRLNFEQSTPLCSLIPDKGIPALDNPILDSPAACKATNRRETGEGIPGSRTKRRLLGAGYTPQVGKFPTGREKWLYEASGASGGVSVKCRPPMPCFRACPQVGTFATSSEKYRFLTVKSFPNKWGIGDAFPGCYSFSTNLIFLPVSSNRINNLPKVRDDGSALLSRKVLSDIPRHAANCSSLKLLRILASSIRTRILSSCLFNGSCFFIGDSFLLW